MDDSEYGENWYCRGCDKPCFEDDKDYYMLKDELWLELNGQRPGMLCMGCVEERLGRKLRAEDIKPCILTAKYNPYTKRILEAAYDELTLKKLVHFGTTDEEEIRRQLEEEFLAKL